MLAEANRNPAGVGHRECSSVSICKNGCCWDKGDCTMTTQTEERTERADRWLQVATDRMLGIEPDWWLRMACGQVAEVSESCR